MRQAARATFISYPYGEAFLPIKTGASAASNIAQGSCAHQTIYHLPYCFLFAYDDCAKLTRRSILGGPKAHRDLNACVLL